jgi:hypothetical protein
VAEVSIRIGYAIKEQQAEIEALRVENATISDDQTTNAATTQAPGPIAASVIAGDGGTRAGGSFVLDGTIGQPTTDASLTGATSP